MWMWPSKSQWKKWSKPAKAGVLGLWATIVFGLLGIVLTMVFQFVDCGAGGTSSEISPESQIIGILMPANEPDPPIPDNCEIPTEALKIFLGNNIAWDSRIGTHTVLQLGGKDLISFENTTEGIFVSATIIREDGRLIAEIARNEFNVNPNANFELKRPDRHELQVFDKSNEQALYVRYINESTVVLRGKFQVPGYPSVIASKDGVSIGGMLTISNSCSGNAGKAAFSFFSPE